MLVAVSLPGCHPPGLALCAGKQPVRLQDVLFSTLHSPGVKHTLGGTWAHPSHAGLVHQVMGSQGLGAAIVLPAHHLCSLHLT